MRSLSKSILWGMLPLLILLPALWWGGLKYESALIREHQTVVEDNLELQALPLQRSLGQVTGTLGALATFVANAGSGGNAINADRFETFASGLHANMSWVRAFQIVTNGVITHVFPVGGNETVVGYDLLSDPRPVIGGDVRRALQTGRITFTGPIQLVQGELGLIVRTPVENGTGAPVRLVAMVLNIDDLLLESSIAPSVTASGIRLAIRRDGFETFFGSASVFDDAPVLIRILLPDGDWVMGSVPAAGWRSAVRASARWFYVAGGIIVILLCGLTFLVAQRQEGLSATVRERTSELAQQHALLLAVVEGTSDAVFVKDRAGRYKMINAAGAQLVGKTPDDIIGQDDTAIFSPETARLIMERDQQLMAAGEAQTYEDIGEAAGVRRIFLSSKAPWRNEHDEVIGLIGVSHDITERHHVEESRREALQATESARHALLGMLEDQRRTEAFLERTRADLERAQFISHTGSWEYRVRDARVQWSDQLYRIFGLELGSEPLTYERLMELIHPEDRESHKAFIGRARKSKPGDVLPPLEYRLQRMDGRLVHVLVELEIQFDSEGKAERFFGISQDITGRKLAEGKLQESENRFRKVFEQAAVGVAQIETSTGRFTRINQRYCDILGYSIEEMLNQDFQTLTHPEDLHGDLDNMRRLEGGEIREFSMEKRYFRKDESVVWVMLTVSPMWKPGEQPEFHIAVVEDITERKNAEGKLRDLNDQLRQLPGGCRACARRNAPASPVKFTTCWPRN